MPIVRFMRYRQYDQHRIDANDAMMGLLSGSKLAAQMMRIHEGSDATLRLLYPHVPHIARLDLRPSAAMRVMEDAERYLGMMAVPYALSIHEALMTYLVDVLRGEGLISNNAASRVTFGNVHEVFTGGSGAAFTAGLVELLQFANRARNCHIHNAGLANKPLVQARIDLDPAHALHWQRVTGKVIPAYKLGDHVPLGVAELVGALHLIKAIGEEANRAFQDACPRGRWADILVEDWQLTSKPGNDNQRWRRLIGMARHEYGPLELTEAEVGAAFRRAA